MAKTEQYKKLLDETLEAHKPVVIQKLNEIKSRTYAADVSHISFELRAGFPYDFPFIVCYMDADNCQIDAAGVPGGFEQLIDEFELPNAEEIEIQCNEILGESRDVGDIEAAAWHQWLYECWKDGPSLKTPAAIAEAYYSNLKLDLNT